MEGTLSILFHGDSQSSAKKRGRFFLVIEKKAEKKHEEGKPGTFNPGRLARAGSCDTKKKRRKDIEELWKGPGGENRRRSASPLGGLKRFFRGGEKDRRTLRSCIKGGF